MKGKSRTRVSSLFVERSIDVNGYFKSMEAVWRRLKDVNLKLVGLHQYCGMKRRILEARLDISMDIINTGATNRTT